MKKMSTSDSEESLGESESDLQEDADHMDTSCSEDNGGNEFVQPEKSKENLAWADAMAKILKTNKPKRRKTIVLSRAKRENQVKNDEVKEEKLDFEIDRESAVAVKKEESTDSTEIKEESLIKRLKKKEWASKGHVKPTILEKDREKLLQKIATRGVVQLFNAVREHQKTLEKNLEEAGPIEHKKDKVLKSLDKRAFLDVLMGPTKSQPVSNLIPKEVKEDPDNPTWSILRDDFMMSSKLKDWDKQDSSEVNNIT
uniref:RRP15-like protein n=1 Tax=Cuerna arida TaxID=1464854 RepID=A0A1B6GP94_9HEMI